MLTSNSVVTPKTHTAIDDNNSESTNTQDLAEYTPETTTTTSTTNIIQQDDPLETTTHIADESSREAITNVSDEPRETTTSISEELRETAINIFEEPRETTTNTSEESSESVTESQDQKEGNVYGDNPGNLPDDAIANEGGNTDKKEVSSGNEAIAGVVNDQKSDKSEKEAQNVQVSEGEQKVEEENQNMAQDEKENPNTKQNAEGENVNTRENQEEGTSGGQQSFDVQGGKNNDDEANVQQLREDKGEVVVMEKEAKEKEQEEVLKKETVATEVDESEGEKKKEKEELGEVQMQDLKWSLCNVSTGGDYIPCLDNDKYLKTSTRKHFVHRERHCPEDAPTCLVPLPKGYKVPIQWPSSRDKVTTFENFG